MYIYMYIFDIYLQVKLHPEHLGMDQYHPRKRSVNMLKQSILLIAFFCTICLSSSQLRSEFWHNWQKCILLILAPFQCSIFYRTAQFPGSILSCVLAIHGERWKTISSTLGTGSKMKFTLRKKNLAIENPTFRHYFPSYKLRFVRGFPSHV
jgi:hypothetical protein